MPQLSQSGRIVSVLSVSQGNVYVCNAGDTAWTAAVNNSSGNPPLNFTGVVHSATLNNRVWFADGTNYVYYDQATNTVNDWVASDGTLPRDSDGNAPRLITAWRGRIGLGGLLKDGSNYFFTAVDDPTDLNYARTNFSPSQAFVGTTGPLGQFKDILSAFIPYNDDVLGIGLNDSIYVMNGDPLAGGQLDLISKSIGMAWGNAWCMDPYGAIYFVSNKMGIYKLAPSRMAGVSSAPQRISQQIEQLLQSIDTGLNVITLAWNDKFQGMHVFVTLASQPSSLNTHLFYEYRTGAWWKDKFANKNHDPVCALVFDGNLPGDRSLLIGSWDGYVRSFSTPATTDDGTPINSSVLLGPINSKNLDEYLFKNIQALLGETSADVTYQVFAGSSAEKAMTSPLAEPRTWSAGRNLSKLIQSSAHDLYVKITSNNAWAMEVIRAEVAGQGDVRRRGR